MLKMYLHQQNAGNTAAYWEEQWGELSPAAYGRLAHTYCENSPQWKVIMDRVRRGRLFIDGGCGHGYWIKYLHDRGYPAVGVDFAEKTLRQIREIDRNLDIRFGDVRKLPFKDGEVHVYFSGGVVEHFEEGPAEALREARRVIAQDGWFLCSVPDDSPLRRLLFRGQEAATWRRTTQMCLEPCAHDVNFFQYAFTDSEFRPLLEASGFEVLEAFGLSVIWGLTEIPGFLSFRNRASTLLRGLGRSVVTDPDGALNGMPERNTSSNSSPEPPTHVLASLKDLPKRLFVREDRSVPVLGRAVELAASLASNMRLYVARPR